MVSQVSYIMRKSVLTGLSRRYGPVICRVCGETIEEGEKVISKQNKRGKIKVCHKKCYETLFLDV